MYFNSKEPNQTSKDNILASNYEQMILSGTQHSNTQNNKDQYDNNQFSDKNQGYIDFLQR